MKRKLALLLALVMVLSVVPMMSFAASENRVSRIGQIKEDETFAIGSAPVLRLEEKDDDWKTGSVQSIRLRLDGAEWSSAMTVTSGVYYDAVKINDDVSGRVTKVTKDSDTVLTVEFEGVTSGAEDVLSIEMLTKVTDAEAKVTIDARDAEVTGGTYVFARSSAAKAIVTIADSKSFGSGETPTLETIEIDESSFGAYNTDDGNKKVTFKLPSGFEWVSVDNPTASGGYNVAGITAGSPDIKEDTLTITFNNINNTQSVGKRGTILLKNAVIKATTDAKFGDVNVRVTGADIDSTSLLVAKYKDFGVTVKADGDAKEIVAGRLDDKDSKDEIHELQKLIIKEDIEGSWLKRATEIEFPSWVKIRDVEVNKAEKLSNISKGDDITASGFTINKRNRNTVEITPNRVNAGGKMNLELTFYVSVEADATGDITALVSGKALDEEYEVTLGKAVAPIEVKTEVKDVKIGVQNQELGKITLTENVAGAFQKDGTVEVKLDKDFRWRTEPTVKVTEGKDDLKIDRIKVKDELLTFRVTRESDKPATIEITGAEVDLYRTLPEGEFRVSVGGDALVDNFEDVHYKTAYGTNEEELYLSSFKTEYVAEPVVARVVTPAPDAGVGAKEVILTIGSTTMFVDGVQETANAAPYIDSADRTMLPVSAIGRALGATVEWNNAARTVLVTKGSDRVLLTIGKDVMNVNGMEIPMRSKAVITGERTFVPLKDLGVALGVGVEWDAATRTVTR